MTQFYPQDPLVSGDFNGWWRRSVWLIRAGWRPMALVQVVVTVPIAAIVIPAFSRFEKEQAEAHRIMETTDLTPGLIFAGWTSLVPVIVIGSLLYLLGQLAVAQLVISLATGRGTALGPAVATAARRTPALLGWFLLAVPVLLIALALCFFPAIYVGAVITILPVVVLVERRRGIGRCFQLFNADLGLSIARIATIIGLTFAASLALTLVTTLVDVVAPNLIGTSLKVLLETSYYIVSGVVVTTMVVTAYADMRSRHERFSSADLI
jgi:hypothetical protein